MRNEEGTIEGDYEVRGELTLDGKITGSATVSASSRFVLNGRIVGDLAVERGAHVLLFGTVDGNVFNNGDLHVHGTIKGTLHDHEGLATIHEGASIAHQH